MKVIEPLVGMILKGLPFSKGGVVENGKVTPFAIGGSVNRPTIFPMAKWIWYSVGRLGQKQYCHLQEHLVVILGSGLYWGCGCSGV